MARSLFTRMFSRPGGDRKQPQRPLWTLRPQSQPTDRLSFMKRKDPWLVERDRRQQKISYDYKQKERTLFRQRRAAKLQQGKDLKREQKRIERHYRLHELERDDPRRDRAEDKAERRYRILERKMEREHKDSWQKALHGLRRERDERKRKVTPAMKKEYQQSRDLPSEPTGSATV
jgi:hypothetical protein